MDIKFPDPDTYIQGGLVDKAVKATQEFLQVTWDKCTTLDDYNRIGWRLREIVEQVNVPELVRRWDIYGPLPLRCWPRLLSNYEALFEAMIPYCQKLEDWEEKRPKRTRVEAVPVDKPIDKSDMAVTELECLLAMEITDNEWTCLFSGWAYRDWNPEQQRHLRLVGNGCTVGYITVDNTEDGTVIATVGFMDLAIQAFEIDLDYAYIYFGTEPVDAEQPLRELAFVDVSTLQVPFYEEEQQ